MRGGRRKSLNGVVFGLFSRGYDVDLAVLRRAYRSWFEAPLTQLDAFLADIDDDTEAAEMIGTRMTEAVTKGASGRFLTGRADSPGELEDAMTFAGGIILGADLSQFDHRASSQSDSIDALHKVYGLEGFVNDQVGSIGPIVRSESELRDDHLALFSQVSMRNLELVSRRVELDQLVRARSMGYRLLGLTAAMSQICQLTQGPTNAFGMAFSKFLSRSDESFPIFALIGVIMEEMLGREQIEEACKLLDPEIDRCEAMVAFLRQTPRPLRRYFGIDGAALQERATPKVKARMGMLVESYFRDHPEAVPLLTETDSNQSMTAAVLT